ncbi:MAG: hypothetical protein O7B32_03990 [Thaumarchaeota archaeon]|nr:hypothetical protein [Nitrososphaerota archaeon]MCZ6725567.1 hypothetical protein [Nitrososphaerota archaeon]
MDAKKARVFGTVIVMLSGTYNITTTVGALIILTLTEVDRPPTQDALVAFVMISLSIAIISLGTGLFMFGNEKKSVRVGQLHLLTVYGILTISISIIGLSFPGTIIMILSGIPLIIFGVLLITSDILMKVTNKDDFDKDP